MLVIAFALSACGGLTPTPATAGMEPRAVLEAYLERLVRGDCTAGNAFGTPAFVVSNGELCGRVLVRAYVVAPEPAKPSPDELVFATDLRTNGSADGSIPPGEITWFYTLRRQPSGAWLIAGGGSGP